ncbi:ABC transporter ATP-binding protein [Candidatus Poribacteria bacterium]|nr:ABC transporter ATP-binding protein [Candidatus Poribacteria bacterium]
MKEFLRILKYARPYLPRLLFGFFLILIIAQSQLVMPLVQRFVIDDILSDVRATELTHSVFGYELTYSPTHWLVVILSTIVIFNGLVGLISYVRTIIMEWVSQRILFDMRNQVFSHLQNLSMRFYDVQGTGQILSRVKEDVSSLRSLVTDTSIDILTDVMMFVTVVSIMFWWSWKLTLISLLILPLVAGNYLFFIGRLRILWRHLRHRWADISTELYESVAGAKVVKAFHRENYQKRRVFHGMRQTLAWQIEIAKHRTAMGRISGFFQSFGTTIVLCYGGYLVIQGEFTVGTLVAYYQYLGRLYGPMMKLININTTIQEAMVSAERVFGLLDSQPTVDEVTDAIELPKVHGYVRFENVAFHYEPENPVLHNISFDVKPDMMVALVGPSGCGKSTIANLIARFYDPTKGAIYIDDHDLRQITLKSLRNQIGIVLQDNFLFQGSVAENIQFGRLDATETEIVEASLAANAHQFVVEELQGGYEAEVGERGMRLSGGQKQRISIARTILRNPRILILDEATSDLDSESESLIQEALDRLMTGRTTFVIAHRLSTILKADIILVMKDGGILEKGTHEELLELDGLYASMYQKQFKTKPENNIDWLN